MVITAGNYIFERKVYELYPLRYQISNQVLYAWNMFAIIVWLLGIASLVGSAVYSVKRYRVFSGIVLTIGLYKASGIIITGVKKVFELRLFGPLDSYTWSYMPGLRVHENGYIGLLNGLYPLILGGLFLVIGGYIFKRYVEV